MTDASPLKSFEINLAPGTLEGQSWLPSSAKHNLLALHGWLDNSASFEVLGPKVANASSSNFYAVDLWGHGLSSHKSKINTYNYLDWICDLHEIITNLFPKEPNDYKKIVLLGHSLGASMCMIYATLYPEHVSHLVLLDAVGPLLDVGPTDFTKRLKSFVNQSTGDKFKRNTSSPTFDEIVSRRMAASDMSRDLASVIMKRNSTQEDGKWHLRTDPKLRIMTPLRLPQEHAIELVKSLTVPTCLIGSPSMLGSGYYQAYKSTFEKLKNTQVHPLEGSHFVHMEKPGECSKIISNFLNATTE